MRMITPTRRAGPLLIALALILLTTVPVVSAQKKSKQVRWWRGSFSDAQKVATERNVPVLIALIQDGEEANERLIDDVFTNPAFVKLTEQTLPIVATRSRHGSKSEQIDGIEREVCKRLGGCTCDHHIDAEVHVFRKFFVGTPAKTPQVMICKPDLELVERIVDIAGPRAYEAAIKKARKKIGPGLDGPTYRNAKSQLTKGRNLFRMGRYQESWAEVAPLVKVGGSSPLVKQAAALHKEIEGKVNEVLEQAYALADKKDYWQAMTTLDSVVTDFAGTPPAKKAAAALKRLGKSKEGRAVAKQLKKQKRYIPWMEKARDYEKRGEYEKARSLYRRVRDKGKKLPIAKQAEAKLAEFRNDPAIATVLKAVDRDDESKELLKEATKKERAGDVAGAKKIYQRLVKDYAGTKAAKTAQSKL